jgi:nicotinamidase/pyrazinamidase
MTRVFVDVDVQNDFCLPDGALSVKGSPNDLYRSLVASAVAGGHPIVGSVDSHAYDAWEFASSGNAGPGGARPNFPDHCVKGTSGWLKVDGTLPPRFRFVPCVEGVDVRALAAEMVEKRTLGLYFEKEVYSLFANPNAEPFLRELARLSSAQHPAGDAAEPLECVVFGVATDYCVKAAALGLRERGYETLVIEDAIRGITPEGTRAALDEMKSKGVKLIQSVEVRRS